MSEGALWKQWLHQPQRVWVRRAIFQVHLWTGLALGLYVVVLSVTGSALVYRRELVARFRTPIPQVDPSAQRLIDRRAAGGRRARLPRLRDHGCQGSDHPPHRRRSRHGRAERRDQGASVQSLHGRGSRRRIHPRRTRGAVDGAAARRPPLRQFGPLLERRGERVRHGAVPDRRGRVVARPESLAAQPDRQIDARDGAGSPGTCTARWARGCSSSSSCGACPASTWACRSPFTALVDYVSDPEPRAARRPAGRSGAGLAQPASFRPLAERFAQGVVGGASGSHPRSCS